MARIPGFFRKDSPPEDAAISAAILRSDRFRQAREPEWRRLESIVARIEKGRRGKLSDADLLELPALYRGAVSSLSIARETSLDAALIAWLEALVERAWFQVYGPRSGFGGWLRQFFGGGWSRAVRGIGPELAVAFALLVAGTVVGWLLVASNADWYGALFPFGADDPRQPGATAAALRSVIHADPKAPGQDMLAAFAAQLFGHNSQIAIMVFALGFAFGVPSALLLIQNAGNLGAILWLYHTRGMTFDLVGWLSIHGTTELFAVTLAAAAGLHIGRAMVFPGTRPVLAAAAEAGRRAAVVMVGVVLMLVVAGLLEGIGRQLIDDTYARLTVGGFMLLFWLAYFFAFARQKGPAR